MFDFAQLLTSSPWPIVVAGGLLGGLIFDWQARGEGFWMRNLGMGLLSTALGGGTAYFIALYSADLGMTLLVKGATGGAAGVWLVLGLLTLWRNNILIGAVLDRWYLAFLISVILGAGFIYGMVYQVHTPLIRWTWFALPILAGALYRLWLVLDFARRPAGAQQKVGQEIDSKLVGGSMEKAKQRLFDPFQTREAADKKQKKDKKTKRKKQDKKASKPKKESSKKDEARPDQPSDTEETTEKTLLQQIGEFLQKDL